MQSGRGVIAVALVVRGASADVAHEVAVHAAFTRPEYLRREDVPADEVAAERATVEEISRNEGKPEAALPKIIEGRLNGWFKDRVLLEQPYVKDDKQTIAKFLGDATIVAYAQVAVGS
jgi:elongation factor Ts